MLARLHQVGNDFEYAAAVFAKESDAFQSSIMEDIVV